MAASAGAGGLAGSKAAKRVKKACASIAATCSTGELSVSMAVGRGAAFSATRLPPPQRRQPVLVLQPVHRREVLLAIGLRTADQPDHRRGRTDLLHALGQRAAPVRPGDDEIAAAGAGRALAGRREHIGPRIHQRHQVVAPLRIGHRQDDRLPGQVEPGRRIQRVGVGADHVGEAGVREGALVAEGIDRRAQRHQLARHVHQHHRIGEGEDLGRQGLHGLVGRRLLGDYRAGPVIRR